MNRLSAPKFIRTILLCGWVFFTTDSPATPLAPEAVPEPLKPWISWVLQDQPELGCPFLYNSFQQKRCSWPSRLNLDFGATKGSFTIDWSVYKESWIALPGNQQHWPQQVSANGKALAVLERNGLPAVKLTPGSYQIKGEFLWDAIPESLNIPLDTGLIGLTINGATIASPSINNGQLWLTDNDTGKKKPENVQNKLDIQVFRKIADDVPMQVTTRLSLEVSGEQREVRLAKPVLDGFIPLSLQSPLPARIEPDGQLLIQLRPGQWQVDIQARSVKETNAIPLIVSQAEWPESEIWTFDARPDLRVTEVEKLEAIDASQTSSPEEWRQLPTYKINKGDSMTLKVIRRGDPEPEPNQLTINRKLWLDFDGEGYTINDTISGKMTKGWRLDALPETKLGRVALDGNSQLITQTNSGKQGVEVRKGMISLDADSRNEGGINTLSAVGWEQNFNQVNVELNMPPGWRLFAASGVDNVPDSWVTRWTLLDLFLVLIASLATKHLFGRFWGFFALFTLVLIWHEPGSPHFVWLNILAATALIRILPKGKFLTAALWYRKAFWLLLVYIALPFMINQIRIGLYPQLEYPWQDYAPVMAPPAPPAVAPVAVNSAAPELDAPASVAMEQSGVARSALPKKAQNAVESFASSYDTGSLYTRYDPDAKVQTGPGLPEWQWHKVYLSWNGSVDAQQELRLWYLSPVIVMFLNFLRIILISLLAVLMFGLADKLPVKFKTTAPSIFLMALLPLLMAPAPKAHADIPSKEVLEELKTRLLEAPDCLPSCAQIPAMKVTINEQQMSIALQVHAQQAVNVPLPTAYEQWFPSQVTIDGLAAAGLYRDSTGLWLQVSAGEHNVVMQGISPLLSSFTLPLMLRPNYVSVDASNWAVSGLQENGQVENQLQFSRISKTVENEPDTKLAPGILPSFARIERTVQLGLDWRVITQIVRLSPPDAPIILQVPLMAGESVTTPGIHVNNGKVDINMPAQQAVMQWESTLNKTEKIELTAAENSQWSEVWRFDVSPVWHIESSGIAMMHLNSEGQWLPEWRPWQGEKLAVDISRPKTLTGQTLTIDNSRLAIQPGKRMTSAELNFILRSSQGAQHTITLPEQAELQTVSINGQTLPLRQDGQKLTLPVNPGKQDIKINWQAPVEIGAITKTPDVNLGLPSVNTRLNIGLGQDRWVLWLWGPKLGPAVLFWGVLVVITLLALGLGKVTLIPLKHWHWLLLLLGLSQVPLPAAFLVMAWLFMLGLRAQRTDFKEKYFNAMQVVIGILTLLSLSILLFAVEQGLLGGSPDMQIIGNQSTAYNLNWYQDRSPADLPNATVISVPLMAYRLLMLLWSFWLASSLLNWLRWGWSCYSAGGLWYKKPVIVEAKPTVNETKGKT